MIFSSVARAFRSQPKTERETIMQIISPGDHHFTPPKANARRILQVYSKHPWTRAVLAKIAQAVAKQEWFLENAKGERIDEHPALDFLRAGVPRLRGPAAMQLSTVQLDLSGESFWIVGREGNKPNGRPIMFVPLPSPMVQDVPDDDEGFYEVVPTRGTVMKIPGRDVLYFKDFDPLEPFERGNALAGAAYTEIQTDEAASEYLFSYLKNRARPDLIITGTKEQPIEDATRIRLEATWLEKFRGAMRNGRPLFSKGDLNIKELGSSKLRDNEFSAIRAQLKDVFTELYGVPPEIMGRLANSNRATIDSADYIFGKHVIDPRLSARKQTIEPWLQREFGLAGLKLRYESPVAENLEYALSVTTAHPRFFTGNEIRQLAGKKPLPGLDDLPPDPNDEASLDPDNDNGPDASSESDKKDDEKAQDTDKSAKSGLDNKPSIKLEKPREKALSVEGVVRVSDVIDDPNVRAEINRFVDDIVGELLEKYGAELLETLEAGATFEINGRIVDWLLEEVPNLVGQVDGTTRDALRASLVEGIAKNELVEALVARVEKVFADAAEWRAPLIGQTVATKITGFASLEGARQAGFEQKKWLSTQDQVVRSTHASLHGQIKYVSEPFQSNSGAQAQHPGAFGRADEDANCRCAMRPILDGEKSLNDTDQAFLRFHRDAAASIATKVAATYKNVFEAQKSLVLNEIRMLTSVP